MNEMKLFNSPDELDFGHTAVALGDFDGVHTAHREVINKALNGAEKNGLKSGVLLFKNSIKKSKYISSLDEKIKLIEAMGVDFVCLCDFSDDFRHMSAEEFCVFLKKVMHVDFVSAGYNYRFGYMAEGDAKCLEKLGEKYGIEVSISELQRCGEVLISSTAIREMIENSDFDGAKKLLGREYSVSGIVEKGFQNGRKLGFKTANIGVDENRCLPPDGVYAGKTAIEGVGYRCVINIGMNPTFDAEKRTVEAHIINFGSDIYGREITVIFEHYLRSEMKFNNIEELKEQIRIDKERVEDL